MKKCFVVTITLMMSLVNANDSGYTFINFVGYDGQTPIFFPKSCDDVLGCYPDSSSDSAVYKYVGGRLIKTEVVASSGAILKLVKNGIYVFIENTDSRKKQYHLKANGKKTVAIFNSLGQYSDAVMNDRYIFIAGEYKKQGRSVYQVNYRNQAPIDTLQITEQYNPELLDADSNHIYYVAQIENDPDPIFGELFRMDIKTGASELIVSRTTVVMNGIVLVAPLKLLYLHGVIHDYGKNLTVVSPDAERLRSYNVFYSYADNAFIIYKHTADINKWHILRLDNVREWKSANRGNTGEYTGQRVVPFR
ncbi:hypothetical protein R80B4_00397 [Fibrobacteres bacterium R8-0-B4]